jgi:hypothetical protein
MDAAIVSRDLIMIARYIDYGCALAGHAQDLLHHVIMGLGPVPTALELPAVYDVPNQIELFAFHAANEVQQQLGLTATRAQMNI